MISKTISKKYIHQKLKTKNFKVEVPVKYLNYALFQRKNGTSLHLKRLQNGPIISHAQFQKVIRVVNICIVLPRSIQ